MLNLKKRKKKAERKKKKRKKHTVIDILIKSTWDAPSCQSNFITIKFVIIPVVMLCKHRCTTALKGGYFTKQQ